MSSMDELDARTKQWLATALGVTYTVTKHVHAHQDAVYKIETSTGNYYLKILASLKAEKENLRKLESMLRAPRVIDSYEDGEHDCLLINELPGKNLVELIDTWSELQITEAFAKAAQQLHTVDVRRIFPQAQTGDVLLHGDMSLPNIIVSSDGEIGYIDFGKLSYGLPELDLADAIWSLQRNLGPDYGELFLKKYGPVAMTPKLQEALAFRYQAA